MTQYIVMTGDPTSGWKFVGPFDNYDAAMAWCDSPESSKRLEMDWWILPLQPLLED